MSTTIEWTDETWNPVTGCEKISPGCKHCYAKALHDMRHRAFLNGKKVPAQYSVPFEVVQCHHGRLEIPLGWRAPRLCFINSMSDLFHEDVPFHFIERVIATVCMTPHITYQALTKRGDRMLEIMRRIAPAGIPNFWPGVSVESKKYLFRLDQLRDVPAPVRMVSFEPLLEDQGTVNLQGIGWAIVGGESGPGARPMHPDWARSLRDQCVAAGVPFFFKQWGEFAPAITAKRGADAYFLRTGKKKAGAVLDGHEWREFPKPYAGHQVIRMQRQERKAAAA